MILYYHTRVKNVVYPFFKYSTICTDKKQKQKELMIRDHMQYKIHINYLSSL